MFKENIYTLMALTVVFALGCAVATQEATAAAWFGFVSAFATSIIAISTVTALSHWKKQERLKYKAQRAAEVSLELSKPLWMLEITLSLSIVNQALRPKEDHEGKFREKLIRNLSDLENALHETIAFKSPLIDPQFAAYCRSWRMELANFKSKGELLAFSEEVHTAFTSAQKQLIDIAAIDRSNFDSKGLMPNSQS